MIIHVIRIDDKILFPLFNFERSLLQQELYKSRSSTLTRGSFDREILRRKEEYFLSARKKRGSHLDFDDRGHVDVGRVAERQLVGCRRLRARREHPQDLQFAGSVNQRRCTIGTLHGEIRASREPPQLGSFFVIVHMTQRKRNPVRSCYTRFHVGRRIRARDNTLHTTSGRAHQVTLMTKSTTVFARKITRRIFSERETAGIIVEIKGLERSFSKRFFMHETSKIFDVNPNKILVESREAGGKRKASFIN